MTIRNASYDQVYRNLDGLVALATAEATPLKHQPDERDTAFVKRIVATYITMAAKLGVIDGELTRDPK